MADVSLAFDILAKDHASKEFNSVGDSIDKAGKHGEMFGKIMAGAVVAGVGAVGAVLKVGFGEVKDYQAGVADLNNVLKTTGNVAGVSVGGLEDLASSIQSYSGQTDDSIVKSEGLLLTFTNIRNSAGKNNDIFTQATKLTADMAQKFGGEASDSAVKLGKALNDPAKGLTALSKIGVSFTEEQKTSIKAMQAHGDMAGAQKVILAELSKEVGGSAQAYGTTLAGQIDRGKRAFENVSQTVVGAAIPAIIALGTGIAAVTSFVSNNQTAFIVIAGIISAVLLPALVAAAVGYATAGVAAVVNAAKQVAAWVMVQVSSLATAAVLAVSFALTVAGWIAVGVQSMLGAAKMAAAWLIAMGPIGLVIAAVVAVAALIFKNWDAIKHYTEVAFKAVWGAIKGAFDWVKGHWPLILAILTGPIGAAVIFIVSHWDSIVNTVKGLPGRIASAAMGMWDGIKDSFRAAINWIIDGWNGLKFSIPGVDTHIPGVGKVGGFTIGTPNIPRLAEGGIVTRPTLALIGEAGPEAVVPLGRGGHGGGPTITVHIAGSVLSPRGIAEDVRTELQKMANRMPLGL